jgi:hypothetical protein
LILRIIFGDEYRSLTWVSYNGKLYALSCKPVTVFWRCLMLIIREVSWIVFVAIRRHDSINMFRNVQTLIREESSIYV